MSTFAATRCVDGLAHAWVGDRAIYCEKCNEIKRRAQHTLDLTQRSSKVKAAAKARADRKRDPAPKRDSCDELANRIERAAGEAPTMWREGETWIAEVRNPATGDLVRFEGRRLSEALLRAS